MNYEMKMYRYIFQLKIYVFLRKITWKEAAKDTQAVKAGKFPWVSFGQQALYVIRCQEIYFQLLFFMKAWKV